jgi:hypothetical protein
MVVFDEATAPPAYGADGGESRDGVVELGIKGMQGVPDLFHPPGGRGFGPIRGAHV